MPGPVSDSYDPEWSTAANADRIREELQDTYDALSKLLECNPIHILSLVDFKDGPQLTFKLSKKQWRMIRFALERAKESI